MKRKYWIITFLFASVSIISYILSTNTINNTVVDGVVNAKETVGDNITSGGMVITDFPKDIKVHIERGIDNEINDAIDYLGNKIGYKNLSSNLDDSHIEELNNRILWKDGDRGMTSVTTDTEIDETGIFDDTDIKINTKISSVSIKGLDATFGSDGIVAKETDSDGVPYNVYHAKISLTTTLTGTTPAGKAVSYSATISAIGEVSTTINFSVASKLMSGM